jgi:CRISPR type IV-associated protein Csf3
MLGLHPMLLSRISDAIRYLEAASKQTNPKNVKYDGQRCYCNNINSYTVCDAASLQLWCLGGEDRHKVCIYYDNPKSV